MRKKLEITEKVTYQDEVLVKVPEGWTEDEFIEVVDEIEDKVRHNEYGNKEFVQLLKELGIEIEEYEPNFPITPADTEFEVFNVKKA